MPANAELQLLSMIIESGDMKTPISENISVDVFGSPEARTVFGWLQAKYQGRDTRNTVPDWDTTVRQFPAMEFPQPSKRMSLKGLCTEVRENYLRRKLTLLQEELPNLIEDDPEKALDRLNKDIKTLQVTASVTDDIVLSSSMEEIRREYELAKNAEGYLGIPYPMGWGYHDDKGKPRFLKKTGRQDHPLNEQTRGMQAGELIVFYGRPKCVVEGQCVLSSTGEYIPIEKPTKKIAALSGQSLVWGQCGGSYAGVKNALRIQTQSGHEIAVGYQHPFIRPDLGFTPANELKVGDYVGVARQVPEPTNPENPLTATEARLLGYLIGDGNYTRNEIQFTKSDPGVITEVRRLTRKLGADLTKSPAQKEIEYRITSDQPRNPITSMLKRLGCHGEKSNIKHIPPEIFRCSNTIVAEFISGYTDTDGHMGTSVVSWTSASRELLLGLKRLLLRFGVTGTIGHIWTNFNTDAYTLTVHSQGQHKILCSVLILRSAHKSEGLHRLASVNKKEKDNSGIPFSKRLLTAILQAKGNRQWVDIFGYKFSIGKLFRRGKIGHGLLQFLMEQFNAPELGEWLDSDIRWEKVTEITSLGKRRCHDITIRDKDPVFLAENFVVKNSMKTWLLVDMMVECYLHQHCRVLCFTKEMSPQQIRTRTVARILGVDYMAFRNGQLEPDEEAEFNRVIEELEQEERRLNKRGYSNSLLITTGWTGKTEREITSFKSKIEEFEPDIVFLDAAYRMQTEEKDWVRDMMTVVRSLKKAAQQYKVPVVVTTQANRKGEESKGSTLAELAFSDAFGQECDLATRIIKRELDNGVVKLACIIAGAREIKLPGFMLEVAPAKYFVLDQIFESQRQIQAQFKAEEEQIAREEEREANRVKDRKHVANIQRTKGK